MLVFERTLCEEQLKPSSSSGISRPYGCESLIELTRESNELATSKDKKKYTLNHRKKEEVVAQQVLPKWAMLVSGLKEVRWSRNTSHKDNRLLFAVR